MVRLNTVLDTWKTAREDTASAVEDFPESEQDFRPLPELMSFREIARHILDASQGLTGLLLAGETNMATPDFRSKLSRHLAALPAEANLRDLAAALRTALETRSAQLRVQPESFYAQEITRMDGTRMTRLEMVQFIKEHELSHRAQLFMYLRLKGIVPPTTRRRLAKAKA